MKTMNFEASRWRRSAIDGEALDDNILAQRRRRRRTIIIAAVVVLVAVLAAAFMFGNGETHAAASAQAAQSLQTVPVMVPGSHQVARTITETGNAAERRGEKERVSKRK